MLRIRASQFFLIGLLAIAQWLIGCKGEEYQSKKKTGEIVIDGSADEWEGSMKSLEKEKVLLGVQNDDENLYICLASDNRESTMKIIRSGLTIWFDPRGGKKKTFGIHYPLGMGSSEMQPKMNQEDKWGDREAEMEKYLNELEMVYPDEVENHREYLVTLKGMKLKLTHDGEKLVYEMMIPFMKTEDHSYAIGSDRNKPVGIGFNTGEMKPSRMKLGGMSPGGGMPGTGGGVPGGGGRGNRGGRSPRGGRPGGGSPGEGSEMPKPIDLWISVKLANP